MKSLLRKLVLAALVFVFAESASADLDSAVTAYNERDYKSALSMFAPLAKAGNNVARTYLGHMYFAGYYVPQDREMAVDYYVTAASEGHVPAQIILGQIYYAGKGVSRDYGEAVKWFRLAANQGRLDAQVVLADLYAHNPKMSDPPEAAKWYRTAAEQGDASAQYSLALLYLEGKGVSKDFVQAHKWLHLASRSSPMPYLATTYALKRDAVAADMTPSQIAEAQQLAAGWRPTTSDDPRQ